MEYIIKKKEVTFTKQDKCRVATFLPTGVFLVITALAMLHIDLVRIVAVYRTRVSHDSMVFALLKKESVALHVSAYLFNVTNAEQFLSGEDQKLKVEEVGPFTYKEVRSNLDIELDEEAHILRYSPRAKPVFSPELSVDDPRNVNVTMPNIAMLAMSSMVSSQGYFTKLGFKLLLDNLRTQAIVNMTAQDFLWGYDEPLIRLGNTILPGWITFKSLGLLDRLYDDRLEYRLEVETKNNEKFKVKSMNGYKGLKTWGYEDPNQRTVCNTFTDAYEGILYPSNLEPGTPLKLFRNVLCRFLDMDYQETVTLKSGAVAYRYKISNTSYQINNNTECMCERGTCLDGISDLSPCYYNLPLALSNAHFMGANPKLYERIEGMNSSEDKHGSEILIEPKIGLVLNTSFSVQVNLVVGKIDFNKQAGRFSEMVVPVCYLKLNQPKLTADNVKYINQMYVTAPNILLAVEIVILLAGLLMLAYCVQLVLPKFVYSKGKGIAFQSPKEEEAQGKSKLPLLEIR